MQVHLPLEWNTYLLFSSDIVNSVWKTNEGGEGEEVVEGIVLLIFVIWWYFNLWWVRGCGVGWKVLFRTT